MSCTYHLDERVSTTSLILHRFEKTAWLPGPHPVRSDLRIELAVLEILLVHRPWSGVPVQPWDELQSIQDCGHRRAAPGTEIRSNRDLNARSP